LIAKTAFAISTEESRYTLNGALLILKPDTMLMVATDGHRLALVETVGQAFSLSSPAAGEIRVLIPRKAMIEVQRLATEGAPSEGEGQIEFARDENNLFFRAASAGAAGAGGRLLISRLLTGQFPNYEAVLPRENNRVVALDRNEFQDALRRVSQLADQRSHAVKFALSKEGIELSASSPEYGEAKEVLEKEYTGEPMTIGFNAQYLLDFLAAAAEGPISIELKDEQSAGQMRPLADENFHYRYIVMPMRI